ncbi:MAG: FHA domain-containing protein [Actinomycetota bacterium]
MATIVIKGGPRAGERIELGEGETLLGRASSEFLSHDEEISRRHAALRSTAGRLEVEDLGSANGTFVNDRRIEGRIPLSSGDVVRLGRTSLEVEIVVEERATVIRGVAPSPVATPPPDTLPQPPVQAPAGPPAFTPPPAAAQPPPMTPPAAQPYAAPPTAGGPGMGLAAALVLFLAALIGLIWAIPEGLRLIDSADFLSGGFFALLLGALILVVVAAAFDVPGGIALMRSRPSGRLLAILGGAAGFAGPVIFAISVITQGGSPGILTWLGAAGTGLAHGVGLVLGLIAGRRRVSGY